MLNDSCLISTIAECSNTNPHDAPFSTARVAIFASSPCYVIGKNISYKVKIVKSIQFPRVLRFRFRVMTDFTRLTTDSVLPEERDSRSEFTQDLLVSTMSNDVTLPSSAEQPAEGQSVSVQTEPDTATSPARQQRPPPPRTQAPPAGVRLQRTTPGPGTAQPPRANITMRGQIRPRAPGSQPAVRPQSRPRPPR